MVILTQLCLFRLSGLKEQHKIELERLEKDLRIGLLIEARTLAEEQVSEQLSVSEKLKNQYKEESIKLRQELDSVQVLRHFEVENQHLKERIQELERALSERPTQQSGQTMTKLATLDSKQVKHPLSLEREKGNEEKFKSQENTLTPDLKPKTPNFIDLRSLAIEPPKENAQECLLLMGMALKNLSSAMNNTQALVAAAIILGSEPTQEAIAKRVELLQLVPVAISEIRQILGKTELTWQEFWAVAEKYEVIKADYWASLTTSEKELISPLQSQASVRGTIQLGSIVCHADPNHPLYIAKGKVVQDLGEQVVVAWDNSQDEPKNIERYNKNELRFPGS
jgi:hypothetical protein